MAETMHQRLMREDAQYALDAEGHGPDCVWRFDHEECENDQACIDSSDMDKPYHPDYHECGSPEHLT